MKHTNSLFRNNSMMPVLLAFVLAVAAAVVTVEISAGLARKELQEQADVEAKAHADYLNVVITVNYRSAKWVINSFLSSFLALEYDSILIDGENACGYILKEETRKRLTFDKLNEMAVSFVNYNFDLHSAVFAFEPGVITGAPAEGFALKAVPYDSICIDLQAAGYHVIDGPFYQKVAQSRSMYVSSGTVSMDSLWVSTFAVPIYDEDGRLSGQFWVDVEPQNTSDLLTHFGSDWDAVTLVVDDSMSVVASSLPEMNGIPLSESVNVIAGLPFTDEWHEQVEAGVREGRKRVFRSEGPKARICTYMFPVLASTYTLLVVQSEDKIYQFVYQFKWRLFAISVSGLLATLACISFIMYAFHRKNISGRLMESELQTASGIQQGILPDNPSPSDLPPSVELYGYQHPAKQVGGDFYDYRIIGNRLCFCIGDVSGKGVPAALVMSQLCSLFRYVVSVETEPAAIVSSINKAVMDRSDDSMMSTFFVGALNLTTGTLDFCNAGHTPPVIISEGKAEYLKIRPNMLLYGFENWKYVQESAILRKGDRLVLYTDGVTEAKNQRDVFFGEEATLQSLVRNSDKPVKEMVDGLRDDIRAFVETSPQHDDVTILCIGYKGSRSVNLHYDRLTRDVTEVVEKILSTLDKTDDMRLRLALEEPLQNIADYAYGEKGGGVDIIIDPVNEAGELSVTLIDSGLPFNPLEGAAPDLTIPLEQRQAGGLGIHFTRQIMKNMSYSFEQNKNHLKLIYQTT